MPSRSTAVVTAEAVVFMVAVVVAVSMGAVVVAAVSMGAVVLAVGILVAARVWAGLLARLFAAAGQIRADAHLVPDARLTAAVLSLARPVWAAWAPAVVPFLERAAPELRAELLTDNGIPSAGHETESLEAAWETR